MILRRLKKVKNENKNCKRHDGKSCLHAGNYVSRRGKNLCHFREAGGFRRPGENTAGDVQGQAVKVRTPRIYNAGSPQCTRQNGYTHTHRQQSRRQRGLCARRAHGGKRLYLQ